MLAIADDLTGAAEIAAIGHRFGWRSEVARHQGQLHVGCLTVVDTDTRLSSAEQAARAMSLLAPLGRDDVFVFKKTDSVLRGSVLAEVTTLAMALGRPRVLLVPANPSLGRVIRDGRYFIDGAPLDETVFAHDAHHPARTADVAALLGGGPVSVRTPAEEIPGSGVIVGATAAADDIAAWARRLDATMLAAGGRDFFTALLNSLSLVSRGSATGFAPAPPTLLVRGSLASPTQLDAALQLPARAVAGDEATLDRWIERVLTTFKAGPFAAVACPRSDDPQAPRRIRDAFAELARRAVQSHAVRHLMIEGGATAASILDSLGWQRLGVAREWAPGIVTLRPPDDDRAAITMKPGSYTWPDALWAHATAPV